MIQPTHAPTVFEQFRQCLSEFSDRGGLPEAAHPAASLDAQATDILALTQELFPPGVLNVEVQVDPTESEAEYLVIDVTASGSSPQILERESQWHQGVSRIIPGDSSWLRICVYPQ
jgi:hypothetical protein